MRVAVVHDYLTQRGGAERVVLSMLKAFPGACVYTSLYEPALTFPEFQQVEVRTTPLNRVGAFRANHRLAFPLLAPAMSRLRVDADLALCSSSGWAHGVATPGTKVVYCHAPARWLYQTESYVEGMPWPGRAAAPALRALRVWDARAALSASRYLVNSTHVAAAVQETYGLEAEVVPPPPALTPDGPTRPVAGLDPGFFLCVARLLAYKNVDEVVGALALLPRERLVVVGAGPDAGRLQALAPRNIRFLGVVGDEELRWLYASCEAVVTAAYEDFGLTPLEAASFGKPAAVLRFGGFLDTLVEGVTGVFFDQPGAAAIARALVRIRERPWPSGILRGHAARFSEERFVERLRAIVSSERAPGELRSAA